MFGKMMQTRDKMDVNTLVQVFCDCKLPSLVSIKKRMNSFKTPSSFDASRMCLPTRNEKDGIKIEAHRCMGRKGRDVSYFRSQNNWMKKRT